MLTFVVLLLMAVFPPFLKRGDTIGIVLPAGYMPEDKIQTCITVLIQWGYKVKTGSTVGNQYHYFSGTDEERLQDLQQMMDSDDVNAILCGRGGYGTGRIIDLLNFKKFRQYPKWIIGYSDITILHCHLFRRFNIASLHSPMAAAFNDDEYKSEYIQSLRKVLKGQRPAYPCPPHPFNRPGAAGGILLGGNLALIAHLIGTPSGIDTRNCLLFIEDTGEYIYNIDRMLHQLKRSNMLKNLAGLIVGSFTEMKDTTLPFGKTVYEVIFDIIKEYDYPVCFGFPVGHTRENYALKVGAHHTLKVNKKRCTLQENQSGLNLP